MSFPNDIKKDMNGTEANLLERIVGEIHTVVLAVNDKNNHPVTCAVDMMACTEDAFYFLTAKGKALYRRLKTHRHVALTGIKGEDTLSSKAVSLRGKAEETDEMTVGEIFEKNPYMNEIYPNEVSRNALVVFKIYEGSGEWFDLSKTPVERESFRFGEEEKKEEEYFITESCTGCRRCVPSCPTGCIRFFEEKGRIEQRNCLKCGNCKAACPFSAVILRGCRIKGKNL